MSDGTSAIHRYSRLSARDRDHLQAVALLSVTEDDAPTVGKVALRVGDFRGGNDAPDEQPTKRTSQRAVTSLVDAGLVSQRQGRGGQTLVSLSETGRRVLLAKRESLTATLDAASRSEGGGGPDE